MSNMERLSRIADQLSRTPFQAGWQWYVEIEGQGITQPNGLQLYLKEISYEPITIETKEINIGSTKLTYPESAAPVDVTMMCRDHIDQRIYNWAKLQALKVVHPDGTVGIPSEFLLDWRRYSLSEESENMVLTEDIPVFITGVGEISESREDAKFLEFPITYKQFRS